MDLLLKTLRLWVGLVGAVACLNAAQCYWDTDFPARRIYTLTPEQATPLFSRMFATWTLLAGVVRIAYSFSPKSQALYWVTFFSFILAFASFFQETLVKETAALSFGTISPFVISALSALWMLAAWPQVTTQAKERRE